MIRISCSALLAGAVISLLPGCTAQSTPATRNANVVSAVDDPLGNLHGDPSRSFLDIVHAEAALHDDTYTFSADVAAPFPRQEDMVGKRLDIIWFVDIDRNRNTGQSSLGNDYNIHLWLTENGWRSSWYKLSPVSKADGVEVADRDFKISVKDRKAELSFPKSYLPSDAFDWWAFSSTQNAPQWLPITSNPEAARGTLVVPH
jgi:hypothetical protein